MSCISYSHLLKASLLRAGSALLTASAFAQASFQTHNVVQSPNFALVSIKGDFNNDGREDLIVEQTAPTGGAAASLLYLSSGDGTYQAPITLPAGVGPEAVGDFNHDGKLDYVSATNGASHLAIYLGNGNGTFQAPKSAGGSGSPVVAVDLNHDSKTDLVQEVASQTLQVWISNGDGSFTAGQTISNTIVNNIVVTGDFDGDGKPDIALIDNEKGASSIEIYYGDGAGHLGTPYQFTDPNNYEDSILAVADANNDGRSALVTAPFTYGVSGTSVSYPKIRLLLGNANRTLSIKDDATTQCPGGIMGVADFNGDGVNDILFSEGPCNLSGPDVIVLKPGAGSGNFGSEQTIFQQGTYPQSSQSLLGAFTLRTTQGTKPDFIFTEPTSAYDPSKLPATSLVLLSNDSTGAFPGCGVTVAEGINICTPGASSTSPVKFSVASAGPTPMRTAAVWVDGKKVTEQLSHAFSNYSFLDASLPLVAGSHAITVFGTGWDNTLQQKSFTLTVGSGGSCPAPAGNGVNLCQPLNQATVSSPVTIQATSKIPGTLARMEVWIDGVKKYTETTSPSLTYSISLATGSHRFAVFAVNTAGAKSETFDYATVK